MPIDVLEASDQKPVFKRGQRVKIIDSEHRLLDRVIDIIHDHSVFASTVTEWSKAMDEDRPPVSARYSKSDVITIRGIPVLDPVLEKDNMPNRKDDPFVSEITENVESLATKGRLLPYQQVNQDAREHLDEMRKDHLEQERTVYETHKELFNSQAAIRWLQENQVDMLCDNDTGQWYCEYWTEDGGVRGFPKRDTILEAVASAMEEWEEN